MKGLNMLQKKKKKTWKFWYAPKRPTTKCGKSRWEMSQNLPAASSDGFVKTNATSARSAVSEESQNSESMEETTEGVSLVAVDALPSAMK